MNYIKFSIIMKGKQKQIYKTLQNYQILKQKSTQPNSEIQIAQHNKEFQTLSSKKISNKVLPIKTSNQTKQQNQYTSKINKRQYLQPQKLSQQKVQIKEQIKDNQKKKKQFYFIQKKQNKNIVENNKKQYSSSESSNQQIRQNQDVLVRKIPQKLYDSYDQLSLSTNILTVPIKLKNKKQKIKSKQLINYNQPFLQFNQQLFAQLPVVEGYCIIQLNEKQDQKIKKFVILKNCLFYDNKKIMINQINKIKILKDDEQFLIRFNYNIPEKDKQNVIVLKIIQNDQNQIYEMTYKVFSQLILRKMFLKNILINCTNDNNLIKNKENIEYEAELYKKTGVFGSWQKRKIKLCQNNFQISKSNGSIDQIKKISQIWTRFQMNNGYLIIKFWHKIQKIQIGIPLCDFTNKSQGNNWLYGLYRFLLNQKP